MVQKWDEQRGFFNAYEFVGNLLKDYIREHLDAKEKARDIVYANLDFNYTNDWIDKMYLKAFNDKDSCLKLLNDERFRSNSFGRYIFKYNQDAEVVAKILEKHPSMVIDFLEINPDKKEEYKPQALDFFNKFQKGEIEASYDYKLSKFFNIYKNDTVLWLDILDKREFDKELYLKIMDVCNDEEVINKMLSKLADESEAEGSIDIYYSIVRCAKNEDMYKRILGQTDKIVNLMTNYCSDFSDEFKQKLLHHPKLSSFGWKKLAEYIPNDVFDDEVIERMLEKIPTETYNTYTEATVNRVIQHILALRPNKEFAQKVLDCCTKLPNYGGNKYVFDYGRHETGIFKRIMELDSSDEMANRIWGYVMANGHTVIFNDLLSVRPSADMLQKIDAYYQSHYKEKAEAKEEMQEVPLDKGEKEQFDYIGYYKTMGEFWRIAVAKSEDVGFLDKILAKHSQNYRKAWRQSFKIKSSYDRESAQSSIEYEKREFEEELKVTGYIKKKLAADYPNLSFEKALSKAFKQMETTTNKKEKAMLHTILNAEGFDFYIDYLKNCEGQIDRRILDYVLKEKEKLIDKLPQYDENERESVYEKITGIEETLYEKGIIKVILSEKYPDLSYEEAIIREAARVVKSGDKKEMEQFNNLILAEGEIELLNGIDERVCDYLVDNFTKQNLDDVNALRSFYGLKIIIDETPFEKPNLRTVRRMQFDDSVSTTDPNSEYYVVQYSEAYRNFVPNKRRRFKESDYYDMMDKSEAFQILFDYGYADFAYTLPQALAKAHVPPEVAEQFNIKDLQAVFYDTLPDEEKDVYDRNGYFKFTRQWIEIEGEYDEADLMGARKSYWMDMVGNKQLVRCMKDDLLRHNISLSDIEQLFDYAEEEGFPNAGGKSRRVNSVFLQLHHVLGLKDGGLNFPGNYAPVMKYPEDVSDGSGVRFSSHYPLHRYDTPKDLFYVVAGAKKMTDIMLTRKQPSPDAKVVRLRTIFTDDEISPHKRVLFYGGARKSSRYIGRLHGMENIALEAEKLGKEYRERDAKSQLLMQIVFQNYVDMHNRLVEVKEARKNKAKKMKIEKNKIQMRNKAKQPIKSKKERNE